MLGACQADGIVQVVQGYRDGGALAGDLDAVDQFEEELGEERGQQFAVGGVGGVEVQRAGVFEQVSGAEHLLGSVFEPFTPTYSSWINQVERLFAEVTRDLLQRSDHRSVQALEKDLRDWVTAWNENPKPFIWTKTADQILESLGRLLQRINGAGH